MNAHYTHKKRTPNSRCVFLSALEDTTKMTAHSRATGLPDLAGDQLALTTRTIQNSEPEQTASWQVASASGISISGSGISGSGSGISTELDRNESDCECECECECQDMTQAQEPGLLLLLSSFLFF